jgi:membrane protease YdiL (CAAX protease family)
MADKSQTNSLVRFFALAYLLSWAIWLPLYSPYFGITSLPVLPLHHALGALGPMLAAFILIYKEEKKKGVSRLIHSMFQITKPAFLIIALTAPFLLLLIAALINYLLTDTFTLVGMWRTREFPSFSFPVYFLYNLLFFGFGEETGWKGYALPKLQSKLSAFTSGIVFTFFWAIWHIPLFLYRPGYMAMDFTSIAGWFFSLMTGSLLLTWLFNSSKGSILTCAVFHATIDMAFVSDFADKNIVNHLGMLITLWGIAIIPVLMLKNKKRVMQE